MTPEFTQLIPPIDIVEVALKFVPVSIRDVTPLMSPMLGLMVEIVGSE